MKPELLFQPVVDDPIASIFINKVLLITSLHIFIPIFFFFFALTFVSKTLLGIFKKKENSLG
jgi:hypothetical protein